MAKIGLKHVVGARLDVNADIPAYSDGIIIGKAITANINVDINSAQLFADDVVCESIQSFKSGKLSLNLDDLRYDAQALLFGHKIVGSALQANSNDISPYVGIGFYGAVVRNNVTTYRAVWYYKVQFAEPSDESKTRGESIEFTTPTVEGSIITLPNGDWKIEEMFATETAAQDWIDDWAGLNVNRAGTSGTGTNGGTEDA